MIGCLIIHGCGSLEELVKTIIDEQFVFSEYDLIEEDDKMIVFTWNTDRMLIWQTALLFESSAIRVGYGFHIHKSGAREEAEGSLDYRLSFNM